MKTARFLIAAVALVVLMPTEADAQFGKRLLDRVAKKAEEAVTRKAEQAVDKAVDKATDPETYKGDGTDPQQQQGQPQQQGNAPTGAGNAPAGQAPQGQSLEMTYAKNDFVPGDEIIFSDELAGEQVGEFPSQWDLIGGTVEVATMNGSNVLFFTTTSTVAPLMKDMQNYLPDVFTVEFDYWKYENPYTYIYKLQFYDGSKQVCPVRWE